MKLPAPVIACVVRHFRQSPERVFDAFLDPERAGGFLFATPAGQMVKVEIDARVGGRFRFVDRRDGEDVEHTGEYLAIERPRRLVFTFGLPQYSAEVDRVSIEIEPANGGCTLTLSHELAPEWAPVQRRAQRGWASILDGAARALGDGGSGHALALVGGGFEWSFERVLPVSPEVAWRALTDTAELERWFAFRIEGQRALGAELRFVSPSGELPPERGVITRLEPPQVLEYTWGTQTFLWELAGRPSGDTLLVLTNTFPAALKAERDGEASWEHCQGALQAQLTALASYLEHRT